MITNDYDYDYTMITETDYDYITINKCWIWLWLQNDDYDEMRSISKMEYTSWLESHNDNLIINNDNMSVSIGRTIWLQHIL